MDREVWEKHSNFIDECLMVLGGHDREGIPVYIGRSCFGNNILPAKVMFQNFSEIISVPFEGRENFVNNCEILVNTGFRWVNFLNTAIIPENAVQAGITEYGVKQYIGRAFTEATLTPGRISADSKILFFALDGEEIIQTTAFEILVVDDGHNAALDNRTSRPLRKPDNPFSPILQESSIVPKSTCSICLEENIKLVGIYMDCGHACLCEACISKVNAQKNARGKVNCPICRKESLTARKIFFT